MAQDEAQVDMGGLTVSRCARCGGKHEDLPLVAFRNPPAPETLKDGSTVTWSYWTTCPATGDPILTGIAVPEEAS